VKIAGLLVDSVRQGWNEIPISSFYHQDYRWKNMKG